MTTVQLAGLSKAFDAQPVLCGADLVVADGSLTAVLGRSGSGKTTLLRLLAGFERPDAGSITIDGEVIVDAHHSVPPERRRIGYVPQEGALFPHLCVADNIAFGLHRGPGRAPRVAELCALVGLEGLERRHPHELSGGQQQRVALARALAPEPRLVLLDEPFSSLDAKMRAELRADVVAVLRKTKTTSVLVTHDQDEALSLADHVAVLRGGRIAQAGPPRAIYEFPADVDIASFVGVANFVNGTRRGTAVSTPLGELAVRIGNGRDRAPDGPVIALIRPEDLEITDPASAGLAARVEHIEYFGHDALLRLSVLDPSAFTTVREESRALGDGEKTRATLVLRTYDPGALAVGAIVGVRCVVDVVVYPEAPALAVLDEASPVS